MRKFLILSFLLALFIISASCGETENVPGGDTEGPGTENGDLADNGEVQPDGPIVYTASAETFDWNEREFRILVNPDDGGEWRDVDFTAAEQTAEQINDAVYTRNRQIESMFNVNIVPIHSTDRTAGIRRTVNAGENAYELAYNHPFGQATLSQEGLLYDLLSVPNLTLSEPWWDQNAVKDLSIANKLYMVTGDIGTMYKKSIGIILFNKDMVRDYNLGDPYALVAANKWTMDEFLKMCSEVSEDLDGSGIWDDNQKYGIVGYRDIITIGLIGGGVKFAEKNADDIPEITFMNERTVAIFEKFTEVLFRQELFWSWSRVGSDNERSRVMFANNQALFNWNEFHSIPNLRAMETDFGILPMPLYSETQERYYHSVNPHVAATFCIPVSNPDIAETGAIIQHLGALGKNILTPAYYDISLAGQHSRDEESIMTMDVIFSSMTYDPGYMYNWADLGTFTMNMVDSYQSDLVSRYERIATRAQTQLETMIEKFLALD
ncbi:MAG: hypothetical protein FWH24_04240 [Oscillospiraceae bacterium]|nr:hypothetical protein [Oscillospiraceae bacterium]